MERKRGGGCGEGEKVRKEGGEKEKKRERAFLPSRRTIIAQLTYVKVFDLLEENIIKKNETMHMFFYCFALIVFPWQP